MKRKTIGRRLVLLAAICICVEFFVLPSEDIVKNETQAKYLRLLTYGASAWGAITILADRGGTDGED